MIRRSFLVTGAMAGLAPGRVFGRAVTSDPDPSKNYGIDSLYKGPPAQDPLRTYRVDAHHKSSPSAKVRDRCIPCEGFESMHIEEETLRTSDHRPILHWRRQIHKLADKDPLKQLDGVNVAVNRDVRYLSDYEHWQVKDKWGFPVEALEEGGDCEDFAILKMESLKFLGWSEERLMVLGGGHRHQPSQAVPRGAAGGTRRRLPAAARQPQRLHQAAPRRPSLLPRLRRQPARIFPHRGIARFE